MIVNPSSNHPLKADILSASFSRANDTFRWRTLSFQSLLKENEISINCNPVNTGRKLNVHNFLILDSCTYLISCVYAEIPHLRSFLIIRKSAKNLKLLWFSSTTNSEFFSPVSFLEMKIDNVLVTATRFEPTTT